MFVRGFTVIVLTVLLQVLPAHAQSSCELDGKPVRLSDTEALAGRSGMVICRNPRGGALTSEQELRNGKLMGAVREYDDGVLRAEFTVDAEGRKEGLVRSYSATKPKNQLLREEEIHDGRRVGRSKLYYPSGRLQTVAAYVATQGSPIARVDFSERGELTHVICASKPALGTDYNDALLCGHGARPNAVDLFAADGRKHAVSVFAQGKRIRHETFWQNGKLRSQEELTANERIWRSFSESGVKLSEDREPLAGAARSGQSFFASGTPKDEQRWENGRLVFERTFYMNGQPKLTREVVGWNGREVRREQSYYDSGALAAEGLFSLEGPGGVRPLGVHKTYDLQGSLSAELHYDDAGTITRERRFDGAGKLTSDEQVFADGSRKRYIR